MAGKPLKAVQELMGHSTLQVTIRHAHLAESTLVDAMEALDVSGANPTSFGHYLVTGDRPGL